MENWRGKYLYFVIDGNSFLFLSKTWGLGGWPQESAKFLRLVESKALEVQQNMVENNIIII